MAPLRVRGPSMGRCQSISFVQLFGMLEPSTRKSCPAGMISSPGVGVMEVVKSPTILFQDVVQGDQPLNIAISVDDKANSPLLCWNLANCTLRGPLGDEGWGRLPRSRLTLN